jgi:hypothetical protein
MRYLVLLVAISATLGGCRAKEVSVRERLVWFDSVVPTNIQLRASEGPGTYIALTNLVSRFRASEHRWPKSVCELERFAVDDNIAFRRDHYPKLKLAIDNSTDDLSMSYKFLKWTLHLRVPAPERTLKE